MVNVGNRGHPTYLPVEVCHVYPGQACNSKLSPQQTQQMIRFAVRRPGDNAESIATDGYSTAGLAPQTNKLLVSYSSNIVSLASTIPNTC